MPEVVAAEMAAAEPAAMPTVAGGIVDVALLGAIEVENDPDAEAADADGGPGGPGEY